jgi:3-(3-hydroxy-phenyl)propionate hydroxylase
MDERFGRGWRLVLDGTLPPPDDASASPTVIDLATSHETEGVVAAWMRKHEVHAALLRPDHYVYGAAAVATDLDALLAEWRAALN